MGTLLKSVASASSPDEGEKVWKAGLASFRSGTYWYWGILTKAIQYIRDFADYKVGALPSPPSPFPRSCTRSLDLAPPKPKSCSRRRTLVASASRSAWRS